MIDRLVCAGARVHNRPAGVCVQVRVYMIDRFGLSRVGRMVLKKPVDAIWHVSVVMYGREYNFADSVAYMELGDTDIATETMHGFAPSHIYEVRRRATPPASDGSAFAIIVLHFTGPPVPITARVHSTPQRPFMGPS
eukprot:1175725-Prorocentrum_minimum.AAC.1